MKQATPPLPHCSLPRRLGAIFYDTLLVASVLLVASLIALPLLGDHPSRPAMLLFRIFLVLNAFGFFAWFWTHGGQTLGMRVWRIRLQSRGGGPISLWQALLRFLIAIVSWLPLGLGFFWSLFDREKLTWHDRYSMSELVVIPKGQARE